MYNAINPITIAVIPATKYKTNFSRSKLIGSRRFLPLLKKIPDTYDLTPDGHEFLANIREDNNWNKIKTISSSIGFASLKVISSIAEGVATAAINQQLGFSK